jgi:polyhydroxybutyrate depolymerase
MKQVRLPRLVVCRAGYKSADRAAEIDAGTRATEPSQGVRLGSGGTGGRSMIEDSGMSRILCLLRVAALLAVAGLACPAYADTIDIKGVARTYRVELADTRPAPLVIVLHGKGETGADMAARTSWPEVAKREHFTVVFPDGLHRAWADLRPESERTRSAPPEGTDDTGFIAALIEKYVRDGTADPKRIYVTGVSNGGATTMTLVCARAELFAAAASVIFNLTSEIASACHPSRAVPMLMMNGTADPLIPFDGGRGSSRFAVDGFWSTEQTLGFWRHNNGCEAADAAAIDLPDHDPDDGSTVTRIGSHCPAGRDVVLYRINDGGHRMPGRLPDVRFPRIVSYMLGPQNHDIDGAETIWEFFKSFP